MSNLVMTELAAKSPEEFVRIATKLAGDLGRLSGIRRGLRKRMRESALMNARQFAQDIEDAYREMWKRYVGADPRVRPGISND